MFIFEAIGDFFSVAFEAIGDFFGSIADWMDDNLDVGAPLGAFIGIGIALVMCFIWG